MEKRKIKLSEVSEIINKDYIGDNITIDGLNYSDYNSKYENILTYCVDFNYLKNALKIPHNKAIITRKELYDKLRKKNQKKVSYILTRKPEGVFYSLHNYLYSKTIFYSDYDYPKQIGDNCNIHPNTVIDDGVIIGDNVIIGANVCIKKGSIISNNVKIKDNTVIGGNGFEVKETNNGLKTINHVGGVKIEENVEIGSNSCIDKSLFEDKTIVGQNTKIDNLVHIAHNNNIGSGNIITAGVVTAGSVKIGDDCFIGIGAKINGGIKIGNNVRINMGAIVIRSIKDNKSVAGFYAMNNDSWLKKTYEERKKYI